MLVTLAHAQEAGGGAAGSGAMLSGILPLILIFAVFYFLLIRPQQKRMKQHQEMVANLRRGDHVVLGGGIKGQVTKVVNDDEAIAEIADGVRVRVVKNTIQEVQAKGQPAGGKGKGKGRGKGREREEREKDAAEDETEDESTEPEAEADDEAETHRAEEAGGSGSGKEGRAGMLGKVLSGGGKS